MKSKKTKKLRLRKETIQDLDIALDRDEEKMIKGGTGNGCEAAGTTQVPIFC